jgi:DNA-directed RNA polymerase beta' subunit
MYIDDVSTGYIFQYKLKHMAESKKGSRSTGDYTMEGTPLKGGAEGARRFGSMEWGALIGHTGVESEIAKDAKLVRGQMNHEFWQKVRNGETPDKPGIPLVHKKFFAHLQAAGINLEDRGKTIHFFGATDEDIRKLTRNRQVTAASTYDAKDLRPIKGGLFDPNIFGENGDQWGYYELPEPILNPMMSKSIQSILGWKQSEMQEVLEGARSVDGKVGTEAVMAALDKMDLDKELRDTKALLKSKSTPLSKRSDLAKKYRALYAIKENDKHPNDFFLTRIPILPPRYRAVSIIGNDVGIVSDANFLYKKMIDAVEDFNEAKQVLPQEELLDARKNLYNSIEAVIGLKDPADPKLQSKKVEGVLSWVTGKSSPKLGSVQRKVFGATVDIGGRNVISPDNSLALDEVGISEETAWSMYEPFVVRKLRQRGMSMTGAVDAVLNRDREAFKALEECLEERPLLINRAPTLHKYSIMACKPKITKGNTLHVSPAICKQFNADFDGDTTRNQVRIHVNLKELTKNIENIDLKGLTFLKNMI